MSDRSSNPPKVAVWLLRSNPVLAGDLVESFREGKSRGWFWWQVFVAIAVSIAIAMRRHWPQICYAITATAMPIFLFRNADQAAYGISWSELPWPWSQLVMELKAFALLDLGALPVLGLALLVNRTFRWVSLLRTQILSFVLLTLTHYSTDIFPWLLRPVQGHPEWRELIIPQALTLVLIFSSYLFAACVGCVPPRKNKRSLA